MARDYTDKGLILAASFDGSSCPTLVAGADGVVPAKILTPAAFLDGQVFIVGADQAISIPIAMLYSGVGTTYAWQVLVKYIGKLTAGRPDPDNGAVDADFVFSPILTTGHNDAAAGNPALVHTYANAVAGDFIQFANGKFTAQVKLQVKATNGGGLALGDRAKAALTSF